MVSGVKTSVKTDVNLKTLIGRGSGETLQMSSPATAGCWCSPPRAACDVGSHRLARGGLGNLLGG